MKDFLKVLGLNLLSGFVFIVLITFILNGEFANLGAYIEYVITTFLVPSLLSSALVKALLLKNKKAIPSKSKKKK